MQPVDVHRRDIDVRAAADDPVRDGPANAAAGQDSDRVQPGRHEVVLQLWRLAYDRQQVGGEALRATEELPDPDLRGDRDPGHGGLQVRGHPVPVRRQLAEREVRRDAIDLPRGTDRLEHAEHQAAALLAVVAVGGRVFQDRPVALDALDRLGEQGVVLGRLKRDGDASELADLAGPHPGAVDYVLGLDVAADCADAGHDAAIAQEPRHRRALDDRDALHPGTPGHRHGHVDWIDPAVGRDVETG